MARSYRHIQEYEKEIIELKEQGLPLRQIGERLGFTYDQLHNFKGTSKNRFEKRK